MKKLCAIFLAALMLLTVIPMAAFAKVNDNDQIITEILNGNNYQHISYTQDNNYFKAGLITYSVFHADTWGSQIKGDTMEAKAAETVLLALIDKIEAELKNETFEKILAALKGAQTGMELVGKVNDLTGKLDFVESSGWSTTLSALNYAVNGLTFVNDEYEKYAEGYAVILTCHAASSYYGKLLDYVAAHCEDENIANVAAELKADITKDLDDASKELMQAIIDDAGQQAALIAIDVAMNTNTVTAIIKTAYGLIANIGDKLFNATDVCTYMSALAAVTRIEDIIVPYITAEMANEDVVAADFAKMSLLTLRESGETMLSNLGTVTADSIVAKVFKNASEAKTLSKNGLLAATKLSVYRDIINDANTHTTYLILVDTTVGKNLTVRNKDHIALATLRNARDSKLLNSDGAFYSIYDSDTNEYIRVVVTFLPDCYTEFSTSSSGSTGSSGGSSSSGSSSSGGGFFASFFKAISDFFASLFSIFKK